MIRFFCVVALFLFSAAPALAEECGPGCPVCSGNSGSGVVLGRNTLQVSGLLIPTGEEERGVINARYGILEWLDAGIGYTVVTRKPLWSLRARAIEEREDGWVPALVVGTGSVQMGGSDQSVYLQASKGFDPHRNLGLRVSAGASMLIPEVNRVYGLAGATATVFERFSFFVSYDGQNFHEGASVTPVDWLSISAMLVESRDLAAAVGLRWAFGE